MRADTQVLHAEARKKIEEALLSYPGSETHVAIYAASRATDWNELQVQLSRADAPSKPSRVSRIIKSVRRHIESELRRYLDIGRHE